MKKDLKSDVTPLVETHCTTQNISTACRPDCCREYMFCLKTKQILKIMMYMNLTISCFICNTTQKTSVKVLVVKKLKQTQTQAVTDQQQSRGRLNYQLINPQMFKKNTSEDSSSIIFKPCFGRPCHKHFYLELNR